MAPLLRASFHGLRCSRLIPSPSFFSSRELLKPPPEPMKPPESSYILRRWYGESVAVEETCSSTHTVNETAGESKTVLQAEVSSIVVDAEESVKETHTANGDKQESDAKEHSSTDKLSSLIMGKLRNKNSVNALKDNGSPLQTETSSPKANKLPEGGDGEFTSSEANKLPQAGFQQIKEDKWNQVMNSMRDMAAKKKPNLFSSGFMSSLARSKEDEIQDDFADLDLPQARNEAVASKPSIKSDSFSRPSMNALRNFTPNVKPKEGQMQGVNGKQKFNGSQGFQHRAQEVKPTSFSFLDSLDSTASEDANPTDLENSVRTSLQTLRSTKDHESMKSSGKLDTSPDVEFIKSFERWNEPMGTSPTPKLDHHNHFKSLQNSSHEAKSASVRSGVSREFERGYVEEKERELSYAKEVADLLNRTTHPGYTVCIQNLPSQSNFAMVKDALSLHGEVVSSFKKPNSGGSCDAFIEYKTAEAMESALASQWLSLDSKAFRIVMADAPITTVVRLSRVSADTTDSEVASICEKFGSLDHLHLKRRATGVYDAYYKANELSNMSAILNCLNEVTVNQRRWVALPAPRLLPAVRKEVLKTREGQAWHASQFSETLNRLETGLEAISVLFEDLKSLAVMEDEISKMV